MAMLSRKPPLPDEFRPAWDGFLDCADVIEGGRRMLLSTLPTGRVEPAPIGVGLDAMEQALADARGWMDTWHVEALDEEWRDCRGAMEAAAAAVPGVREVAANTTELEDLLTAVANVIEPLDRFADAERAWRRRWRVPRVRA